MSARKSKEPREPQIGELSHAMLRQALDSTRARVAAAADAAKATAAESNPEVTRVRRVERGDDTDDLRAIADAQRGHAKTIATTAADHKTAIDDLIRDLADLFDA